jgi:hypothetical protein
MAQPSGNVGNMDGPLTPLARQADGPCYFIFYWVREDRWIPRESLIRMHPLEWLVLTKRETLNRVRLASWQEVDPVTYQRYHQQLAMVDDEFSEPTAVRLARLAAERGGRFEP